MFDPSLAILSRAPLPAAAAARRRVLQRLALLWATQALHAPPASAQAGEPLRTSGADDPFTLGVASGECRPRSIVLWTRLAPQPLQPDGGLPARPFAVRWELAADSGFARVVRSGEATAWPEHGHSLRVQVTGLPPDSRFFYRFMIGGHASPVGRTRTAPAAGAAVARVRFALASCQHYQQGHYAAHREIAERDADFVVFTGDYIYENESHPARRVREHATPSPRNLADYRRRYASYRVDPGLQALHAAHPWYLTWDDHEVQNDYTGLHSAWGTSDADFLRLRAAAYKAYFEHMPLAPEREPRGAALPLHDRYTWGRLADIFTVDTRQFRQRHACASEQFGGRGLWRCEELANPAREVLGRDQEAWLAQGMAGSTATWKLLVQSMQMSSYGIPLPLARPLPKVDDSDGAWTHPLLSMGRIVHNDGWDGYPVARERLLRALHQARVGNVLVLGGDAHRYVAANLRLRPNDERSPVVASEFIGSSLTSYGLNEAICSLVRWVNPDIVHMRGSERGYAWLDLSPKEARCELRATGHPVRPDSRFHTQASFVVEAGRAGPQPA